MFIIPQYIIISKHIEKLIERAQDPTEFKLDGTFLLCLTVFCPFLGNFDIIPLKKIKIVRFLPKVAEIQAFPVV